MNLVGRATNEFKNARARLSTTNIMPYGYVAAEPASGLSKVSMHHAKCRSPDTPERKGRPASIFNMLPDANRLDPSAMLPCKIKSTTAPPITNRHVQDSVTCELRTSELLDASCSLLRPPRIPWNKATRARESSIRKDLQIRRRRRLGQSLVPLLRPPPRAIRPKTKP